VHHHTFNWINQQDAATSQVYITCEVAASCWLIQMKVENDRSCTPLPLCAACVACLGMLPYPLSSLVWSLHCTKLKASMAGCPFCEDT
jgi:hypothetical protein